MRPFTIITLLFLSLIPKDGMSQIKIIDDFYQTFDGRKINVWLIEGEKIVLNIDKSIINETQLADISTLTKILVRTDSIYKFYINSFGEEPPGGNAKFSNKCNVFFGAPSCGSGCGAIGSKGIEVSGFKEIFYNLKYNTNVNRDVIIGYEFGRNFFTFSDKILFPYDSNDTKARNGGFAEGFASMMYLFAFDEIIKKQDERELNETFQNIKWNLKQFRGYINDTTATPFNSLARWDKFGVLDPNRGLDGWNYDEFPAYSGTSILIGIFDTFGKENLFPHFYNNLKLLPKVVSIEDALSNIALATSQSIKKNLIPFFENVLKFKINSTAKSQISKLEPIQSKLIRDESSLWFISPFEKINLNLRSTNYLSDKLKYRVLINNSVYSENINGNNLLTYDLLKGNSYANVKCQLIDGKNIIDEFSLKLKKRDKIDIIENKDDLYAYYLSNSFTKSSVSLDNNLTITNLENDSLDYGLIFYNVNFSKNRVYKLEGEIKISFKDKLEKPNYTTGGLNSKGYASVGFYGPGRMNGAQRVGYDLGIKDTLSYYKVSISDTSNLFMPNNRQYFMNRIGFNSDGYGIKSKFKNLYFYDITDTDKDGIIDFDDDCVTIPNILAVPSINLEINKLTTINEASNYQWYLDNNKIEGATDKTYIPVKSGNYFLITSDKNGCKSKNSNNIQVTITGSKIENSLNSIFPNPSTGLIMLNFDKDFGQEIELKIYNFFGKEVFFKPNVINQEIVNLEHLPIGSYLIQLRSFEKIDTIKYIKIN